MRVRDRMAEIDITAAQLAVQLDVPLGTVKGWMSGQHLPAGDKLSRLAKALRTNQTKLLVGAQHA
jgi:transcriptional regulator with XRE-family HTH domain